VNDAVVLVFGAGRQNRIEMQRTLAQHGFTVMLASSQAEAAKCIATGRVRAVVMSDALHAGASDTTSAASPEIPFLQQSSIPLVRPHRDPDDTDASASHAVIAAVRAALSR
jgi:hypothetical protein